MVVVACGALGVGVCYVSTLLGVAGTVERAIGIYHATLDEYWHRMAVGTYHLIPFHCLALLSVEHVCQFATLHLFF